MREFARKPRSAQEVPIWIPIEIQRPFRTKTKIIIKVKHEISWIRRKFVHSGLRNETLPGWDGFAEAKRKCLCGCRNGRYSGTFPLKW